MFTIRASILVAVVGVDHVMIVTLLGLKHGQLYPCFSIGAYINDTVLIFRLQLWTSVGSGSGVAFCSASANMHRRSLCGVRTALYHMRTGMLINRLSDVTLVHTPENAAAGDIIKYASNYRYGELSRLIDMSQCAPST